MANLPASQSEWDVAGMVVEKKQRGGSGRGQGRKPQSDTGEVMKPRAIRMTDAEWNKLLELGGSAWIREKIKQAKLPEK